MKKYYIYHIKGKKIGVSTEPKIRVKRQGEIEFEILETHTDIYKVSDREIELQKQYGYKVDKVPYWKTYEQRKKYRTKENCSKGGKVGGKTTGAKAQKEKIGFFAHNEKLTPEELYIQRTKGAVKKRVLNQQQIDFVKSTYYKITNQYDVVPVGKMTTSELAKHFNVSKKVIRTSLMF